MNQFCEYVSFQNPSEYHMLSETGVEAILFTVLASGNKFAAILILKMITILNTRCVIITDTSSN